MPNLPSNLAFCALLSYTTHPTTEEQQHAKDTSLALKQGKKYLNPPCSICELVAQRLFEHRDLNAFAGFFGPEVLAVPIPSSSLKQPGSLWIPHELALALKGLGLVGDVLPLVKRQSALPKAATSVPSARPKAAAHYESVVVEQRLIAPSSILLVDDVVTRGATMLGIAGRVKETYPHLAIRGFAAMRAISEASKFNSLFAPCKGTIRLSGDQTIRRP